MKNVAMTILLLASLMLYACSESLGPLSPGSTAGKYASGTKSLMPLNVGNRWTYHVILYDTSGMERGSYNYDLRVLGVAIPDTNQIPLRWPMTNKKNLVKPWYLLSGELGDGTFWQFDTLDNLRYRPMYDTLFFEQSAFNFRAEIGDSTRPVYIGEDTVRWASGDIFYMNADSIQTRLVSTASDTLRTTLGSSPWYRYRESYKLRTDFTDYYFKPGFGLFLKELYQKTPGGRTYKVRRDELVSYFLN